MNDDTLSTEVLLDRVAGAGASSEEWGEFVRRAATDRDLWERALRASRAEQELRSDFERLQPLIDSVELPNSEERARRPLSARTWMPWFSALGWAAAVVVTLSAWGMATRSNRSQPLGPPTSSSAERPTPKTNHLDTKPLDAKPLDAKPLDAMLDRGSLASTDDVRWTTVEKLPPVVLRSRPGPSGVDVEMWVLRSSVERAVVEQLYGLSLDELGQLKPVPVRNVAMAGPERF